jgi:hypothetical protein
MNIHKKILVGMICVGLAAPAIASWKSVTKGAGKVANDTGKGFEDAGKEIEDAFTPKHAKWTYTCRADGTEKNYKCCDPRVTKCSQHTHDFTEGSDLGKHSIGGGKTHTMRLHCPGDAIITDYHYDSSGGMTKCTMIQGTMSSSNITLSCSNVSGKDGSVWLRTLNCFTDTGDQKTHTY